MRPDQRGYAVCTLQRSGSNLLCQLLASTGVLGVPREYFNTAGCRMNGLRDYPDDPGEQLDCVRRLGATPNGVYGLKVFPWQFDRAAANGWAARLPNLTFIALRREDLLGQAISLARARQTGQWRSTTPAEGDASFDPQLISACLLYLAHGEARWRAFFARNDMAVLRLVYETFIQDPQATVDEVAARVGVDAAKVDASKLTMSRQRDEQSSQWRERFLREAADRTHLDLIGGVAT